MVMLLADECHSSVLCYYVFSPTDTILQKFSHQLGINVKHFLKISYCVAGYTVVI